MIEKPQSQQMKCTECGARVSTRAYECKRCGKMLANTSGPPDEGPANFAASFLRGLHDHFNPALHAVEEVVNTATKRSKQK